MIPSYIQHLLSSETSQLQRNGWEACAAPSSQDPPQPTASHDVVPPATCSHSKPSLQLLLRQLLLTSQVGLTFSPVPAILVLKLTPSDSVGFFLPLYNNCMIITFIIQKECNDFPKLHGNLFLHYNQSSNPCPFLWGFCHRLDQVGEEH